MAVLVRTLRRELELRRRQENFLAAVSHEFRSPLASMRLGVETLLVQFTHPPRCFLGLLEVLEHRAESRTLLPRSTRAFDSQGSLHGLLDRCVNLRDRRACSRGPELLLELRDPTLQDLRIVGRRLRGGFRDRRLELC